MAKLLGTYSGVYGEYFAIGEDAESILDALINNSDENISFEEVTFFNIEPIVLEKTVKSKIID